MGRWLPQLPPTGVRLHSVGGPDDEPALETLLDRLVQRRRSRTGDGAAVAALGWTVVVVDRPLPARLAALLHDAAQLGVLTLTLAGTAETLPLRLSALLTVGGETGERAVLSRRDRCGEAGLLLDRLPEPAAEELARDLAPLQPPTSGLDLPLQVHLLDLPLPGLRLEGQEPVGGWTGDRGRLIATLGHSVSGPVQVDLCRDGPHALVAGTTGSGKSELLQTLITGLALAHPPDRCSFLLVDYKGGAAFAEAARLPHTVGVLTDLDGPATERALRSLGAELLRRERLLAAHQVNDLAALPEDVALARLVIVVDEFATLAEELPTFLPGLVGIAQRGRSLGVHLVLATQRPGGVVSPEIRANCTLRICLRTTDEADSRDVLGLPDAAHLPVGRPGLALMRAGSGAATVLQVARVAARRPLLGENPTTVRRWSWPCSPVPAGSPAEEDTDLATICTALRRHAAGTGASLPHRPWRPPLPERFGSEEMGALLRTHGDPASEPPPSSPGRLRIGLVDRPAEQAWDFLEFDVAAAGGWLAVGGARSGRTTLLRTVLGEAVHQLGADRLHVHVLDHGGGALAAEAADLPHAGTVVSGEDPLRTVRLVERLIEEVGRRRAGSGPPHPPTLLLLVDGVESLLEQLDEFEPRGGSASFLRLVREGAAVGLTCVLTAARAVPGGRLASAVSQRLVLPLADKADYVVAGVPASSVPSTRHPGRALVGESALECQLALPRRRAATAGSAPRHGTALRIPPLPDRPELPLPRGGVGRSDTGTRAALLLPVGPGGDEAHVLAVDLSRTGGLLVAGPPGSGRSSALTAFAGHLGCSGIPVLWLAPAHLRTGLHDDRATLDPADEAGVAAWVAGLEGRPGAIVADDLGLLGDAPALTRIPPSAWSARVLVLAAGGATDLARQYQGPVAVLRRQRAGLLLCPGPGDGDVLGVRLPRTPIPRRPGSGWLVTADAVQRVQVARRTEHRPRTTPVREPV